mmetsp:Transcript_4440/g.6642  ORF Transcript_4440/g.6642 Transcript_4440/m.6642 type:complete len:152 (+) Transcript_4440:52-507(+)
MGVACSRKRISEYEEKHVIEEIDEYDENDANASTYAESVGGDSVVSYEGKENPKERHIVYQRDKTTHQRARGCCAGGGKANLYITTIVLHHADGTKSKYKERRYAYTTRDGARGVRINRYKRTEDKNGKRTKYIKQSMNDPDWPRRPGWKG